MQQYINGVEIEQFADHCAWLKLKVKSPFLKNSVNESLQKDLYEEVFSGNVFRMTILTTAQNYVMF